MPAFLTFTKKAVFLEDREIAVITADTVEIYDFTGNKRDFKIFEVQWDASQAEKGGYPHFMLKEILEQPQSHSKHSPWEDLLLIKELLIFPEKI